jgi:hypothetical protein
VQLHRSRWITTTPAHWKVLYEPRGTVERHPCARAGPPRARPRSGALRRGRVPSEARAVFVTQMERMLTASQRGRGEQP